jgi:hypothetical protein
VTRNRAAAYKCQAYISYRFGCQIQRLEGMHMMGRLMYLFIGNMVNVSQPKTDFILSSKSISRLLAGLCNSVLLNIKPAGWSKTRRHTRCSERSDDWFLCSFFNQVEVHYVIGNKCKTAIARIQLVTGSSLRRIKSLSNDCAAWMEGRVQLRSWCDHQHTNY